MPRFEIDASNATAFLYWLTVLQSTPWSHVTAMLGGNAAFSSAISNNSFLPTPGDSATPSNRRRLQSVISAGSQSPNRHIRVEFLTELLPPVLRRAWYLFLDLASLGLFALIVVTGIEAIGFNHAVRTVALQIPVSTIIWLVPAGFALAAIFMLEEIVRRWKRKP